MGEGRGQCIIRRVGRGESGQYWALQGGVREVIRLCSQLLPVTIAHLSLVSLLQTPPLPQSL